MKTFVVTSVGWKHPVEVDDSIYEKYADQCCEAATCAVELFLNEEIECGNCGLGPFMQVVEHGRENNDDYEYILLTEHVLRNAGRHHLADEINKEINKKIQGIEGDL